MINTLDLIWEEKKVLDYLRDRVGREVPFWDVVKSSGLDQKTSLSLISRLLSEQKLIRNKRNNTLRISELVV